MKPVVECLMSFGLKPAQIVKVEVCAPSLSTG